jgi:hypothetical protein
VSEHESESPGPPDSGGFDPYRYGRPDPNPTQDAFGRPLSSRPPQYGGNQYGPPQPPGYPPGYPPPGYPPYPTRSNGMAVAGLVLGIVSLALCWLTVLDIPLIILGVTFAGVGLARARRGAGGRGSALAGLICSLVAAVLVTVIIVIVLPKYLDCYHKHGGNTEQIRRCVTGGD